jgi:UMF1 family MFS transporter
VGASLTRRVRVRAGRPRARTWPATRSASPRSHEVLQYGNDWGKLRTVVRAVVRRPALQVHVGPPVRRDDLRMGRVGDANRARYRTTSRDGSRAFLRAPGRRTSAAQEGPVLDPPTPGWKPAPVTTAPPAAGTGPAQAPADRALKRERFGWYSYDWAMSVFNTSVTTVFLAPYLTSIAESAADADGRIHPLGISVPAGSFFGYVLSLSVLLQVLVLPLTGAIADRSGHKRQLLAGFATLGALCTMAMFFVAGERYLLGASLFIVANLCFGAATVVYYSWLPDLAGPDERDAVSSRGWAVGYLGGALLLAANLALFTQYESLGLTEGEAVRICLASAGLWWAGFTVVSVTLLRNRRPQHVEPSSRSAGTLSGGFRQLGATLRDLRRYRLTLWFLAAYLLYNDGVQTVIGVSAQYGAEQLELSQTTLVSAILLVQVVAFFGALTLGRAAAAIGARRTVLAALVVWTGVLAAAYFLQAGAVVQFYLLASVIGLIQGGTQALSRSMFSQLIPPGKEAEYFGFYEISDRGTSWLGPFLFALTYQLTDSYRYAIFSLVFFFVVGGLLLAKLDLRRAIVEAGNTPPERL